MATEYQPFDPTRERIGVPPANLRAQSPLPPLLFFGTSLGEAFVASKFKVGDRVRCRAVPSQCGIVVGLSLNYDGTGISRTVRVDWLNEDTADGLNRYGDFHESQIIAAD